MNTKYTTDEKKLAADLKKITVIAGKKVLSYFGKAEIQYHKKNAADFVTQADLASNKIVTEFIKKNYPMHGIISEEEKDYKRDAEYVWIIDPLDGTRNFSKHTPFVSIIIAIMKKNKIIMGAIYNPFFKDLYFAQKGKGAYRNNQKIHCTATPKFEYSFGAGEPIFRGQHKEQYKKFLLSMEQYHFWTTDLACLGMESVMAADGQRDWFCQPICGGVWDLAGGYIILKESGCNVTNFSGKEWSITDTEMLAANPILHKQLLKILNS